MPLTKPATAPKPAQIRTVLVVEDSPDQLFLIQASFGKTFHQARLVPTITGPQAIAYLEQCLVDRRGLPALILLDLYLPRREDGWQVLETIRSMPAPVNSLPVIMLSNSKDPGDIFASYDRRITSYILKPLAVEDWADYFQTLREYWDQTASLPGKRLF